MVIHFLKKQLKFQWNTIAHLLFLDIIPSYYISTLLLPF